MSEKRIGLFGGTFNPIHLGHLRGAEEIREAFNLHEVIFITAAIPPHKELGRTIEAHHRLEMVRQAIQTNPNFATSDIEIKRAGKSYSIDTIRSLREKYPGPLFFILGRDAFMEIVAWKEFPNFFSLCNFIVMTRPGSPEGDLGSRLPEALAPFFRYDPGTEAWLHISGHTLHFKEITFLEISSTKIRELVKKGKSTKYLTPHEVTDYIEKQGLYQNNRNTQG